MNYPNLQLIRHPLIEHKLTTLRDKNTDHLDFRRLAKEIAGLMLYEVMRNAPTKETTVETPIITAPSRVLAREISIVLILRAGLGMADGLLDLIPEARVGHIGLYRNEETLEPVEYYSKLPTNIAESEVILVDPMLATGGSLAAAVKIVQKTGAKSIKCLTLLAAPEGVKYMAKEHPEVPVFTAALDERLNENGYIVPGLGDAGDRLFGTK